MPGVCAGRARIAREGFPGLVVLRLGPHVRAAGRGIESRRPVHHRELGARDELAGLRVEHVEEAVLRRVHHDAPGRAADLERRSDDLLGRVEVPTIFRRLLEVPDVFAGVGSNRDDRRGVEVVALGAVADDRVPGLRVRGAEVDEIGLGIVRDRVPHRAAAAELPPLAAPGLRGLLEVRAFEGLRRIAGHRVETPSFFAGLCVEGGEVAARDVLRAGGTNNHFAFDDARRAGDRHVRPLRDAAHVPDDGAGGRVERNHVTRQRRDEYLALVDGHSAVHGIAAHVYELLARHLRVVRPEKFAGRSVERLHHRPSRRDVHHAVDHDRSPFLAARAVEVERPGEPERADVAVAHGGERREALLVVSAAIREPVRAVVGCGEQPRVVDVRGGRGFLGGGGRSRRFRGRARRDPGNAQCERQARDPHLVLHRDRSSWVATTRLARL